MHIRNGKILFLSPIANFHSAQNHCQHTFTKLRWTDLLGFPYWQIFLVSWKKIFRNFWKFAFRSNGPVGNTPILLHPFLLLGILSLPVISFDLVNGFLKSTNTLKTCSPDGICSKICFIECDLILIPYSTKLYAFWSILNPNTFLIIIYHYGFWRSRFPVSDL